MRLVGGTIPDCRPGDQCVCSVNSGEREGKDSPEASSAKVRTRILQASAFAWGEPTAQEVSDVVGTMGTVYRQVFTLDASGGLRIDKFSQWIHYTAEGAVMHSPGIRRR